MPPGGNRRSIAAGSGSRSFRRRSLRSLSRSRRLAEPGRLGCSALLRSLVDPVGSRKGEFPEVPADLPVDLLATQRDEDAAFHHHSLTACAALKDSPRNSPRHGFLPRLTIEHRHLLSCWRRGHCKRLYINSFPISEARGEPLNPPHHFKWS